MNIDFRDAGYFAGSYGRKRVHRIEARLGDMSAFGRNKTEAKAALEALIEKQCEHLYERRYLTGMSLDGKPVTFCFYYNQGWTYDIHTSDHPYPSSCGFNEETTRTEAFERMKKHFQDYTGTTDEEPTLSEDIFSEATA